MKKKLLAATSVLALTLTIGTSAFADVADSHTNDVDITVQGGDLSLETSAINSFGEIDLRVEPTNHTTGFEEEFTVTDLRGTHDGWNLNVSASQFENENNEVLPLGSLTLGGDIDIERVGDGLGELATSSLTGTTIIDQGEISVATAEDSTGMGVSSLEFDEDALTLTVDATTAKVGTYVSTLTWNLLNAPQ